MQLLGGGRPARSEVWQEAMELLELFIVALVALVLVEGMDALVVGQVPVHKQLGTFSDPSTKSNGLALKLFPLPKRLLLHLVGEKPHEGAYLAVIVERRAASVAECTVSGVPYDQALGDVRQLL